MVRRVLIVAIVYSVVLAVSAQAAQSDLPKTMQAVAMDHTGGPDVLQLRTLPVPGVGADEVLIATLTASVGVWLTCKLWRPHDGGVAYEHLRNECNEHPLALRAC